MVLSQLHAPLITTRGRRASTIWRSGPTRKPALPFAHSDGSRRREDSGTASDSDVEFIFRHAMETAVEFVPPGGENHLRLCQREFHRFVRPSVRSLALWNDEWNDECFSAGSICCRILCPENVGTEGRMPAPVPVRTMIQSREKQSMRGAA